MLDLPPHCAALLAAKTQSGLTFSQIAEKIGKPEVWTTALFFGQATTDDETASKILEVLGGDDSFATYNESGVTDKPVKAKSVITALSGKGPGNLGVQGMVTRGGSFEVPPKDPVLYRLYEVLVVYGYSYKAIIAEKFGDGIMSAIDFRTSVERKPDPKGDRVVITLDGKFLPYSSTDKW